MRKVEWGETENGGKAGNDHALSKRRHKWQKSRKGGGGRSSSGGKWEMEE
jgi:hypothetical protein